MVYNIFIFITGILLFVSGITDIRKKQVSRTFLIILFGVCMVAVLFKDNLNVVSSLGGFVTGACVAGISMVAGQQIGRGDGFVIAAIGIMLGFYGCLTVLCIASFVMCVAAVAVLITKRGNRHTRLAFIPAIFTGYAVYTATLL